MADIRAKAIRVEKGEGLKDSNCTKHRDSLASCPGGTGLSPGSLFAAGESSIRTKAVLPTHNSAAFVSLISNYGSSAPLLNVVMVTVEI